MAEKKIELTKEEKLDLLIKKVNSDFGNGTIITNDNFPKVKKFSTGSFSLDKALGGGWARGRIIEILGNESAGKAQPLWSKILTPNGWVEMGNLEVGQIICAPDGTNTTVVEIFPQGKQKFYEIIFDDKSFTYCTADHLWQIITRGTKVEDILTTQQILDKGLQSPSKCRKFKIPETKPLEFNGEVDLPLDPYLLGLLLGAGSFRGSTIEYSTIDKELLDNIQIILDKDFPEMMISKKMGPCDYHLRKKKRTHEKSRIWKILKDFNLINKYSEEKHIPKQYLFSSIYQRTRLLQGLMDSDGSVSPNNSISYSTSSPQLSKNFEFLTRSLGIRCNTSSRVTKYTSKTGKRVDGLPSFRSSLLFGTDIKPVSLSRKVENLKNQLSGHRYRYIESIKLFGEDKCQCIMVGHPDQLYITDNFVVTHNSTIALHAATEIQKIGGVAAYLDSEHSLDGEYAKALGVNLKDLLIVQAFCGEDTLEIADEFSSSGVIDLVIIDSVASLVPKTELEGKIEDQQMGLQARMMSKAMRMMTGPAARNGTTIMFINQFRQKIGMYGGGKVAAGGNALKYYASQRVELYRPNKPIEKNGEPIGIEVEVNVIKNKVAPPFEKTSLFIRYGQGVDTYTDVLRHSAIAGIVVKGGAWYTYKDIKIQGEDNMSLLIRNKPELYKELVELLTKEE